jgi:nitroimidazol reductase NimA-like FMN-containing flavoprotein (pyridoxamine 5'-phosphate oxidase superfamily)
MGIELSRDEIDSYLQAAPRGILCVTRDGQAPLALPMWFAWVDGRIVMHTSLKSKKVAALHKHPLVSFLVESGEHYWTLKAALIIGECEVVDDQAAARAWMARIEQVKPLYRDHLFPTDLPPHLQRLYEKDRAAVVITPRSITSWDFAKVRR